MDKNWKIVIGLYNGETIEETIMSKDPGSALLRVIDNRLINRKWITSVLIIQKVKNTFTSVKLGSILND